MIVHYSLKEVLEKIILELLIGYAKRSQENVGEFTIYFSIVWDTYHKYCTKHLKLLVHLK